jgi:hypothetical protein
MLSPLRNRFGIPGVISVIALVFAMMGGAYAATNSEGGGKATASAKAKAGPRGPRGKTGSAGPAGPAGPQGPAGPAGAKGDTGAKGDKGDTGNTGNTGSAGASVTSSVVGAGGDAGHCVTVGGSKFVAGAGTTYACNGAEGEAGEPWTPNNALPSEATETGTWGFTSTGAIEQYVPIGFSIPLADAAADQIQFHISGESGFATPCPGTVDSPKAKPGNLCVYRGIFANWGNPNNVYSPGGAETLEGEGIGASGVILYYESMPAGKREDGSFAITAP